LTLNITDKIFLLGVKGGGKISIACGWPVLEVRPWPRSLFGLFYSKRNADTGEWANLKSCILHATPRVHEGYKQHSTENITRATISYAILAHG